MGIQEWIKKNCKFANRKEAGILDSIKDFLGKGERKEPTRSNEIDNNQKWEEAMKSAASKKGYKYERIPSLKENGYHTHKLSCGYYSTVLTEENAVESFINKLPSKEELEKRMKSKNIHYEPVWKDGVLMYKLYEDGWKTYTTNELSSHLSRKHGV